MKSADRLKRLKLHVRERIQKEIGAKRGASARLSEALGVSTAHIANLRSGKAEAGEQVIDALCLYWGITRDELEAEALGVSIDRPLAASGMSEQVRRAITNRGRERGLAPGVVHAALESRARIGIEDIDIEQVDTLLDLALGFDRSVGLLFRVVPDAGTDRASDDVGPGKRPLRRRAK